MTGDDQSETEVSAPPTNEPPPPEATGVVSPHAEGAASEGDQMAVEDQPSASTSGRLGRKACLMGHYWQKKILNHFWQKQVKLCLQRPAAM